VEYIVLRTLIIIRIRPLLCMRHMTSLRNIEADALYIFVFVFRFLCCILEKLICWEWKHN
jgi:hypothetical protein